MTSLSPESLTTERLRAARSIEPTSADPLTLNPEDMKIPILVNLTRQTILFAGATTGEQLKIIPTSGWLFLEEVPPIVSSTTYGSGLIVKIETKLAEKTLDPFGEGYAKFQTIIKEARDSPALKFDLVFDRDVAKFLAKHPDCFDHLENIRILSSKGGYIIVDSPPQILPSARNSFREHPWKPKKDKQHRESGPF